MHVKESVKEFVHDVKRKFSRKHKRESCSTCTSEDYYESSSDSDADSVSHHHSRDYRSSSSISSLPGTPEQSRFVTFARPRVPSSASMKHHKVLHKVRSRVRSLDGKRYRLFSSERASEASQPTSTPRVGRSIQWSPLSIQDAGDECETIESSQGDHTNVLDIRAQSADMSLAEESTRFASHDSSLTQFDKESQSDTSGTLVTAASDRSKSVSESDSRFDSIISHSDGNPIQVHDIIISSVHPMAPAILTSAPDPAVNPREDEVDKPTPTPPVVLQASRTMTSAQPTRSTSASPAPVYIPRLTAPSMFLPIPNTDPLSVLLTKHVPAEQRPRRDVAGEYAGRDIHEMVTSNSWRSLAKMARDRIVASNPEDLGRILDLWSLRLSSLARLRLTNQASAECTNLFAVLNAVPSTSVPGSFPGSGSLPPSVPLPPSPAPAASLPLSPSGLSGLAQLPGTPSQKLTTLPPSIAGGTTPTTAPRQGANELVHPFELTVFHARVHYWSGDMLGYVDALSRILGLCKEKAREEGRVVAQRREIGEAVRSRGRGDVEGTSQSGRAIEESEAREGTEAVEEGTEAAEEDTKAPEESTKSTSTEVQGEDRSDDVLIAAEANLSMWLERFSRVCLILASQMIEMNDYQAAINLLAPLCTHRAPPAFVSTPSPALHSALARIYLLSGNLQKAKDHFSIAASAAGNSANGTDIVAMNTALLAAASGDWTHAEEALGKMITKDPGNFTAINNLSVTLLCQGRIKEGIDLLESALKASPSSVVVAEPFLFNLSTLYELRSTAAIDKKRELLLEVATWSGDGLRTSCLKMPSS